MIKKLRNGIKTANVSQELKDKYKKKFWRHIGNARMVGTEFLLTFEEWINIWLDSGHLEERGHCRGQYVMARFGDKGPYAVGNVKIITAEENCSEKVWTEEARAGVGKAALGNKYNVGRVNSAEAIARTAKFNTGTKRSPEVCANIRKGLQLREAVNQQIRTFDLTMGRTTWSI